MHIARYALDSTVLPLVTETLPVAEAVRRALMGLYGRLTEKNGVRGRSNRFSGKDEGGQPLSGHTHAYYLPTDEDGDGRLEHLTLYAAAGFDQDEQNALDGLHEIRMGRAGKYPLRLFLLGMGMSEAYRPDPLGRSTVWESATPYIATRHAKTRGRYRIDIRSPEDCALFLRDDLLAQLTVVRSDLFENGALEMTIKPLRDEKGRFTIADRWRPIQFVRSRGKAGDDGGGRLAGSFQLIFAQPVRGPIALGGSSHFGMGLFVPVAQ